MIGLTFSCLLLGAPAAADAAAAVPAKPPTRLLQRSLPGGLAAAVRITPGVPQKGKATRVIIEISKRGAAGPIPLNGARLTAQLVPNAKATKDRKMRRALVRVKPMGRVVHELKDRGSYGFHATLPASGSYGVRVEGELKGEAISFEFGLHPDLWPAPDLQEEQVQSKSGRSRRPLRRR